MKARTGLGVAAGALLLLSSAAHALLGWPPFGTALAAAGFDGQTVGALAVGWFFGSASMLVFAAIVLNAALDAARGRPVAVAPLWIIAAGYLGFGFTAWLMRDLNPHFLMFVVTGLLVAAFAWRR